MATTSYCKYFYSAFHMYTESWKKKHCLAVFGVTVTGVTSCLTADRPMCCSTTTLPPCSHHPLHYLWMVTVFPVLLIRYPSIPSLLLWNLLLLTRRTRRLRRRRLSKTSSSYTNSAIRSRTTSGSWTDFWKHIIRTNSKPPLIILSHSRSRFLLQSTNIALLVIYKLVLIVPI